MGRRAAGALSQPRGVQPDGRQPGLPADHRSAHHGPLGRCAAGDDPGVGVSGPAPRESRDAMKALTWHGRRDVRVDTVPDPKIEHPDDIIVRITSTGICGSDLHLYEVLGPFLDAGDIL